MLERHAKLRGKHLDKKLFDKNRKNDDDTSSWRNRGKMLRIGVRRIGHLSNSHGTSTERKVGKGNRMLLPQNTVSESQLFGLNRQKHVTAFLQLQTYIIALISQLACLIFGRLWFTVDWIGLSILRVIVQKHAAKVVLVLMIALCGCKESGSQDKPSKNGEKFLVVVVGDGVPPVDVSQARPWPLNRAQGEAMYDGVRAALNESPSLQDLRSIIEIAGRDDRGEPERASQLAKELQHNPRVLAVIGHATSETTRHAAWIYEQAGIPILMPIATSPEVMYHPKKGRSEAGRIQNAFRLPPSDDKGQAPAVTHLVRRLGLKKVYLLSDTTKGARGYSLPLRESLEPYIRNELVGEEDKEVMRGRTVFGELARSIRAQGVDGVVFCGYGTTSLELLDALDETYGETSRENRPTIVLTDGCLIPDLDARGFNLYLTFPHVSKPEDADKRDIKILEKISNGTQPVSYEGFGYDAMLIIGSAIKVCMAKGVVDRKSLIGQLNSSGVFIGTSGLYEFENGENRLAQYDILRMSDNRQDGEQRLELDEVVTARRLQVIRAQKD